MGEVAVPPRYNTEIPHDDYFKYRNKVVMPWWAVYHGSDFDMIRKTAKGTGNGLYCGISMAVLVNIMDKPQLFSYSRVVERAIKFGTPCVIAGGTYGLALSIATNLRNKEDAVNHLIGGYAAGTLWGSWFKNNVLGMRMGLLFAVLGGATKLLLDNNMFGHHSNRRTRMFDIYSRGILVDRPSPEGEQDAELDTTFKKYTP